MNSDGWKLYTLGELREITSSKRIYYSEYTTTGIPFFRSREIIERFNGHEVSTELFISSSRYQEIKNKFGVPKIDDLLLTSVGTLGIPYLIETDESFYFKDGNLTWFRDNGSGLLVSKYLFYWLQSKKGKYELEIRKIGTTQQALTIEALKKVEIQLPPLPLQHRIAEILSALDEKIELNRQTNATLEAIAQAIFKEWFVDFNYPGATGEMVESELGMIPKGWRVGKLGEICKVVMGQSPPGESYNEIGEGIPFYQGRSDFGFRFPTKRVFTTNPKRFAEKFNTLVSVRAPVGDMNIAAENCCIGRGLAAVIEHNGKYTFTYYFLKELTEKFKGFEDNGTIFGSINKKEFENMPCIVPSMEIVFSFEETCKTIDHEIFILEKESNTLRQIRNSLLPRLMSRELQV